jgi:DNA topoisomerase-3
LVPPNERDSLAVDARQEIDLRIGAAFTRFQTRKLREKFTGLPKNPISYGPCQFPTLGFVVQRFLRIQNFIPENFWTIFCSHEKVSQLSAC